MQWHFGQVGFFDGILKHSVSTSGIVAILSLANASTHRFGGTSRATYLERPLSVSIRPRDPPPRLSDITTWFLSFSPRWSHVRMAPRATPKPLRRTVLPEPVCCWARLARAEPLLGTSRRLRPSQGTTVYAQPTLLRFLHPTRSPPLASAPEHLAWGLTSFLNTQTIFRDVIGDLPGDLGRCHQMSRFDC